MEIVIDIDEDIAQGIIDGENDTPRNIVRAFQATIADAIKNGTPLPKHHGRLIDVKQIVYEKECIWETDGCCTTRSTPNIAATPTIIEADKGVLEKINEKQDSLRATCKAWDEVVEKDGYVN